ncbi:MAG: SecY-interacting protein Syd [Clostridiaceae bacterium]
MKQVLNDYFERKYLRWEQYKNSLPMICWEEDIPSFMYVGEVDNEGYIQWKAKQKGEIYDFKQVKDDFNVELNPDIKDYFDSYWFLELNGVYEDYSIILEPVAPGIELKDFYYNLGEYYRSHEGKLEYIPIGFESDGFLVVVNNKTGEVFIEDHERMTYEKIADSLKELIKKM